ncbi:hypothetical protein ABPD32_002643 [Yersinia enterocolitica]|uniref:hypothetical protein n=1 Tax=Yersinia TaxID=629 RepID=UPI0005E96E59|nr:MULTISPECIES: hypothetical protein [Yersinia]EKN3739671.1 hypothetical protein [Yersinia enterocolitica]EKN5985911.1 hypothetical protein [Yersinia enterocolitica]EKN5989346.1 hypothetical protein [Yersinia enterocolitica]ELI8325041.1 hypothetical protein [Yersinia enterocolitica]ELX2243741.1 hypothetical protein [Yersinia enterocolitica]
MNSTDKYQYIFDMLKNNIFTYQLGYLSGELSGKYLSDVGTIQDSLEFCGLMNYSPPRDNILFISLKLQDWKGGVALIYHSLDQFWEQIKDTLCIPEQFYLLPSKASSLDATDSEEIIKYKLYISIIKIIALTADHEINNEFVFFITDENGGKKIDVKNNATNEEILKIEDAEKTIKCLDVLVDKLNFSDVHKSERRSVTRSALMELLEYRNESINMAAVLEKCKHLGRKYDELYELYTNRFSINKMLNELDEKSIEFTSKINEYISSSQNKAFTIPGALIAVGALVKVGGVLEASLIMIGLWMISSVTKSANEVYRDSYNSLEIIITSAFKKYLRFDEGDEVTTSAKSIEIDLVKKISKAKARIKSIDRLADGLVILGAIYLCLNLFFPSLSSGGLVNLVKELFFIK